jgi:hypothetical protein
MSVRASMDQNRRKNPMRVLTRRFAVGLATIALSATACGQDTESKTVMPEVTGTKLDAALRAIKNAGFKDDVDVDGGGLLGIIDESNWTVCSQTPVAGHEVKATPRLKVDRSCANGEPEKGSTTTKPSTTSTTIQQRESGILYGESVNVTIRLSSRPDPMLAISVAAPITFTPSDPKDARQTTNLYFTVTVTNTSPDPYEFSGHTSDALCGLGKIDPSLDHLAGKGVEGDPVYDAKAGVSSLIAPELAPGQSVTFKDGFSVSCSADDVTYKLRPAGLASDTLLFQK